MKSIYDKSFHYVPAASTDLKATFRRIKRELREADARNAQNMAEAAKLVTELKPRKVKA